MAKVGRNQICPYCSSGKKYKKCCGNSRLRNSQTTDFNPQRDLSPVVLRHAERHAAAEQIRQEQQGLGKPIISTTWKDQQFVAVGDTVYYSKNWKTFPDFLNEYIAITLGREWGDQELKKKYEHRHIILQWYQLYNEHKEKYHSKKGVITSIPTVGVCHCYFGLAYNLYLLKHNVELQKRFIDRLKDINNFQGAYYELIVANCLIRAGFELELENEVDDSTKHCEFSAVSSVTGKKYWVEAKSRSVVGVLGKTEHNGTRNSDPTCRLSTHLKNALLKPANDERLIFIDVNAPHHDDNEPDWFARAESKLRMKDSDLPDNVSAYIFVTNFNFHYRLDKEKQWLSSLPYGLGIPDFTSNKPIRFIDWYKNKQKHIDAHNIIDSFTGYLDLPQTFDGSLPSEQLSGSDNRIEIGKKYFFEDIGENGLVGTVTEAIVDESNKRMLIFVDGSHVLSRPISDDELRDYKKHPNAYFGKITKQGRKANNIFEFFENIVDMHMSYSKESTLNHMKNWPNYGEIKKMDKKEIVLLYSESIAIQMDKISEK